MPAASQSRCFICAAASSANEGQTKSFPEKDGRTQKVHIRGMLGGEIQILLISAQRFSELGL